MRDDERQQLQDFIAQHTGLEINEQRQQALQPLINEFLDSNTAEQVISSLSQMNFTNPIWQEIIQPLTIGETYFFRNRHHFAALRNQVLPALIEKRRSNGLKQLRIWCAGCSTGEEPYSIAILLRELLPDIKDWSVSLLATDINEAYMAYAKQGVYHKRSFRNETPEEILENWFEPTERGYQIKNEIRRSVIFAPLNLVSGDYPSYTNNTMQMDLIICRNVTIYFDTPTTKYVAERFHRALSEEGWLLVGHSEPNTEIYKEFMVQNFENAILYQKHTNSQSFERPATQPLRPAHFTPPPKTTPRIPPAKPASRPVIQAQQKPTQSDENHLELAQQAANNGNWNDALELLNKAQRYDNLNPYIHYLRGLILQQQGHLKEAITSLQQAVYCDAQFALGHYILGDLLATTSEQKKAIRHWRTALKVLANFDADYEIPSSDGLTVEMLNGLISYRLGIGK